MNRYAVSAMPAISPSQLLALKALDPLHEEEEPCEDRDGQQQVEEIGHGASLGASVRLTQ